MDRCDTCGDVISFCKCYEDFTGNLESTSGKTNNPNMLDLAIDEARYYHRNDRDKAGKPYLGHLIRVMNLLDSEEEKIVGVLHDIVEDGHVDLEYLRAKSFNDRIIEAIDAVTKRKNETYEMFISRLSRNPLAIKVKLADLEDNMDISRLNEITAKDRDRIEKYKRAKEYLINKLT